MSRRRVVLLTADFPPDYGGIQRLLAETSLGLAAHWDVTVVAPKHDRAFVHDEGFGVRIRRTRSAWGKASRASVLAEMALMLRHARPDVVLVGHASILPATIGINVPRVLFAYGSELWAPSSAAIVRRMRDHLAAVIAISRFTADQVVALGIESKMVTIIPPGAKAPDVPPDAGRRLAALGLTRDGAPVRYFVTVARLAEPHKGIDTFLRAVPAIAARHPDVRYVIAGDGVMRNYLRRVADSVGANGAVVWAGAVSEKDKGALLAQARAHVMLSEESNAASQFEGFGIVYVEAALLGTPSLAAPFGGVNDVVQDGRNGLMANPRSSAQVIDAALRLLEVPGLAQRLGGQAREDALAQRGWPLAIELTNRLLTATLP